MSRRSIRTSDRGSWTQEDLNEARACIYDRKWPVSKVAIHFAIPKSTLRRRMRKNNWDKVPMGGVPYMERSSEAALAQYICKLRRLGFSPAIPFVRKLAFGYANNFTSSTGTALYEWFLAFMERNASNPELIVRNFYQKGELVDLVTFFDLLEMTLDHHDLTDRPENIFAVHDMELRPNKPFKQTMTLVVCANAKGEFTTPPYCIVKGYNIWPNMLDGAPLGTVAKSNRQSHTNTPEFFHDWLENQFLPRKPPGVVLLLLDSRSSLLFPRTMELAEQNDIAILGLPTHTMADFQPLVKSFVTPFLTTWQEASTEWQKTNNCKMSVRCIGEVLKIAWRRITAEASNATEGFQKCGIFPFDRTILQSEVFVKMEPPDDDLEQEDAFIMEPVEVEIVEGVADESIESTTENDYEPPTTRPKRMATGNKVVQRRLQKDIDKALQKLDDLQKQMDSLNDTEF